MNVVWDRVEHRQAVLLEQIRQRRQREVRRVFVVDLIECGLGDDVAPIRILDDAPAVRREQDRDALDDGMQVGDMRQRVGRDNRVRLAVRRDDLPCHLAHRRTGTWW